MFSKLQIVGLIAVLFASFAMGININAHVGPCDDMRASSSVGACIVKDTCDGILGQQDCGAAVAYTVMEDFPTSCVAATGKNCNEPLANCYGAVSCVWQNNACATNGTPTVWQKEKKRKTVGCTRSGDPG